ncbi:MAG: hypothetical protein M0P76_00955 [Candidatus Pacebacteria bacterium]|jgi:hypothetical protein|nr:hypothetical protein [Candidatus Paceibacterota bacterium]
MEYKLLIGYFALFFGIIGYIPYYRDIFRGKTKPHVFTWLIITIIISFGFYAQIKDGGSVGAWVTGARR